ncbi:enolase C-terminal domain-like protein [Nocardia jiangxiensis]|uniref:Enolase C-terminal domain-like protein n=1 Tax=Nocardia jiangxiensis TaxID=282685 RepID=A0ABW6SG17_9NOCA
MIMPPWEGSGITITGVKAILTAPEGTRLVVVKVQTSEPGLYGVGCATFSQRAHAVASAIEDYLAPLVIGRDPGDIEDIWQSCFLSSYWRGGPVLNNALSGIDQALWDIKGKLANVPVYQLFGGKVRRAADVYVHVKGQDVAAVADKITGLIEQGYRHVRAQPMSPGRLDMAQPTWDGRAYTLAVPRMFDYLRSELGSEIELIHDVHERLSPIDAIALAKNLEPYDLYFLEDLFAPEDHEYLRMLRAQSPIAIASGELYVNQQEYVPLVRDRLIDFIRVHVSALGGLTPARKLATLCEFFGVKTAWHGPDDVSPVGHMAQLHLDLSVSNFGIHEAHLFGDRAREVFPGLAEVRDGALWSNDNPGLGIDVDEAEAARYPYEDHPLNGGWPTVRTADGTIVRP